MLGQLGQFTVGVADNIMLGRYGKLELSAASLSNSIFFLLFPFILGITSSLAALVPEAGAKKDEERIKKLFTNGLLVALVISLVSFFIIKGLYPYIYYLDQPKELIDIMEGYTSIIMMSSIPMALFFVFRFTTDGLLRTYPAMIAMVLGNFINIALNYLLIYGKFGFSEMGLEGAAIGTLVSRIFMLVFFVVFFYKSSTFSVYLKSFSLKLYDKNILKDIFRIGIPSSLQLFFEIGAFASIAFIAGTFGVDYIAANQISIQVISVSFFLMTGISMTTTIRIGDYFGKKDFQSIEMVMKTNTILVVSFMLFMGVIFLSFRDYIPLIFNDDPNVVAIASSLLVVGAVFQLSDGIQMVGIGALKGLQDVKIPMLVTFIAYWVLGMPIGYFLGNYFELKTTGIWIGLSIGLTFSAVIYMFRFYKLIKNK